MLARVLGREGTDSGSPTALVAALLIAAALCGLEITCASAKVPGGTHCYGKVCHRVKTLAETGRMVGKTLTLTTSYYDAPNVDRFNVGLLTSSGERFDARNAARAASSVFPDGTELLLWNPRNGRAAHVRVNDFGPFHTNRTLDITRALAEKLGLVRRGVAELSVTVIAAPPPDEPRYRAFRKYPETRGYLGEYSEAARVSLSTSLIREARGLNPPLPVKAPRLAGLAKPTGKPTEPAVPKRTPTTRIAIVPLPPPEVLALTGVATEILALSPVQETIFTEEVDATPILPLPSFAMPWIDQHLDRLRYAAVLLSAPTPAAATRPGADDDRRARRGTGPATAVSYLLATAMLCLIALLLAVVTRPLHAQTWTRYARTKFDEDVASGVSPEPSTLLPETTVIGADLWLKGDVVSAGDVRVEGCLQGNCRCRRLHVTAEGQILGDVTADELVVEGKIVGSIFARSVRADDRAEVAGRVEYAELVVARDARVNALCRLRTARPGPIVDDDDLRQAA